MAGITNCEIKHHNRAYSVHIQAECNNSNGVQSRDAALHQIYKNKT
jgi:hypothetical protein